MGEIRRVIGVILYRQIKHSLQMGIYVSVNLIWEGIEIASKRREDDKCVTSVL